MALSAPLLTRKRVIQVKVETTKGTLIAVDTDILAFNQSLTPDLNFTSRKAAGKFLGHTSSGIIDGPRAGKCSFDVELRPTAGAALDLGLVALLTACGVKQDAEVYKPTSVHADQKTVTIAAFEDGKKKQLVGAMGNAKFRGVAGERVWINFEFTGIWQAPADGALPTWAPTSVLPLKLDNASGAFTLATEALKINTFEFDLGNQVILRPDAAAAGGLAYAMITDRDPTWTIDPESDLVAGYDIFGDFLAGTEVALALTVSNGTRNMAFAVPKFQYRSIDPGDREGVQTDEVVGQCNIDNIDNGDDEWSLTVT